MKRSPQLLAGLLAGALGLCTVAGAQADAPSARAARGTRVALKRTSLGMILVNGAGFTLYEFSRDSRNRSTCPKVRECSTIWPALSTGTRPTGGPGVRGSLLSSIRLPSGARQVTYAGHPLYLYGPAAEPGETEYAGVSQFGGTWYAVNAVGNRIR